jgi:hypothetical protein
VPNDDDDDRSIRFDKFVKSVLRLLGEYRYFCVNSRLHVVNIRQSLKYRLEYRLSVVFIALQSTV